MSINKAHARWMNYTTALVALGLCFGVHAHVYSQAIATQPRTATAKHRSWLDSKTSLDQRVTALIQQMTLAEKIGQLSQANSSSGEVTGTAENDPARDSLSERIRRGEV